MLKRKKKKEKKIIVVQGSLHPQSYTSLLIDEVRSLLLRRSLPHEYCDIRAYNLDFCDGRPIEKYNQATQDIYHLLASADAYIFGMPVYSYSISGGLKNLIDITHHALEGKVAGIVCHATGANAYHAAADLMKVLSFEARVMTVHPIVHTDRESFQKGVLFDDEVRRLVHEMIDALARQLLLR